MPLRCAVAGVGLVLLRSSNSRSRSPTAGLALAAEADLGRVVRITDPRDRRVALYRWKERRNPIEYERQVRALAASALQQASSTPGAGAVAAARSAAAAAARKAPLRRRLLRRRSGSACFDGLGCAVGVHHHPLCLRRAVEAQEAGQGPVVASVLLPATAPAELYALARRVAPLVLAAESAAADELLEAAGAAEAAADEVPVRFATAFPVPRPLAEMRPPFVVLDGLGSAMNVGQVVCSAFQLGISSFIVSRTSWNALNGRAARVSDGWLYHADFHLAEPLGNALRELKRAGVALYAAEDFFPRPVSPHLPRGSRSWALVVGNEDMGVSKEVAELCDERICIPQRRGASLNVATATALCLYELARYMED